VAVVVAVAVRVRVIARLHRAVASRVGVVERARGPVAAGVRVVAPRPAVVETAVPRVVMAEAAVAAVVVAVAVAAAAGPVGRCVRHGRQRDSRGRQAGGENPAFHSCPPPRGCRAARAGAPGAAPGRGYSALAFVGVMPDLPTWLRSMEPRSFSSEPTSLS